MKKIITYFIIILLLFLNINSLFADCSIQSSPNYITEFLKNVRKASSNINSAANKTYNKKDTPKNDSGYISDTVGALMSIFNWKDNETSFEYSIQEEEQEIPKQIKRDIEILEKEFKKIKLKNKKATRVELSYEEICKGISEEICLFEKDRKIEAIKALAKVKKAIKNLESLLQNQATELDIAKENNILFFPDKNIDQLKIDYSKESLENCSKTEDQNGEKGFFQKIIEAFKKLGEMFKTTKKGKNSWQEAIDMLNGNGQERKEELKNNEEKKENLKKSNILKDTTKAQSDNKKEFNNEGTGDNNYLNSLKKQSNEFQKSIEKDMPKINKAEESAKSLIDTKKNISRAAKTLIIDINAPYTKLKEAAQKQNEGSEILLGRLIKMHVNIASQINVLNKNCKNAQKVCNSQKIGMGDCGQCN